MRWVKVDRMGTTLLLIKKKDSIMNDSEKIEAIKKTLSHNIDYKKLMRQYLGFIQDIVDDKMTMTEVDDYIKVLIREHN
jgi:division protein CdvB (Snf7/Vps24/ESCRT-III family)